MLVSRRRHRVERNLACQCLPLAGVQIYINRQVHIELGGQVLLTEDELLFFLQIHEFAQYLLSLDEKSQESG